MVYFSHGNSISTKGDAYTPTAGENISVDVPGFLVSDEGTALRLQVNNAIFNVRIDGTLHGGGNNAAGLRHDGVLSTLDLTIGRSGKIHGTNIGLALDSQATVTNDGSISSGYSTAVRFQENAVLNNNGLISSYLDEAILFGYGTNKLVNTGIIDVSPGLVAINVNDDATGADTIINTGIIRGNIRLGLGADIYDGSAGHLTGKIFGGDGMDWIRTGTEDDFIDGGADADRMEGGKGNDTYRVDNAGDVVVEGKDEGTADIVLASTSYTLGKGVYVEFLQTNSTAGTAAINLTGNELSQTIIGNAGANTLTDGGGAGDVLKGLGGNDIYRVASAATTIVETSSQGTADVVLASVSYVLNKGAYIEFLQTNSTAGTTSINLTGNEVAQTLVGNAGANRLDGKGGADTLTGRDGKDTFVFSSALNLGVDTITDFKAVDDTIELSKAVFTGLSLGTLSTSAFRANTTGLAGDASDRIIYETDTGKLYYDADGIGTGASGIHFATLAGLPTITNADFVVV